MVGRTFIKVVQLFNHIGSVFSVLEENDPSVVLCLQKSYFFRRRNGGWNLSRDQRSQDKDKDNHILSHCHRQDRERAAPEYPSPRPVIRREAGEREDLAKMLCSIPATNAPISGHSSEKSQVPKSIRLAEEAETPVNPCSSKYSTSRPFR
ncbi:hypothetical protein SODALDRAFT_361467 [Sodiomyces alkalinus F11]|uniref:Uncharacterized protein n=1 Tax=Sodiomyces alkalinus (strain CBS 110278 / VKM F-3762 / F11) TaxID=1314773 RepID=A0A3N2PTH5_SODAK|nr:hypothetical protein SODALDRAFT_361467 [Sodiomyces alkalinus F11]ROT37734.1 hypothetical protein SODALDRAFT_361467 [Sodiomyces alkalinus F11]